MGYVVNETQQDVENSFRESSNYILWENVI